MNIGISTLPTNRSTDIAILAKHAEEMGFESIWAPEQPILPVQTKEPVPRIWGDIVDPLIMLARASAVTSKIKLGTAVLVVPEHNPLSLAKKIATLDMYSGGRFILGIGTGSVREEGEIMGSDFPHRWTQAREAVMAMKELWMNERSEFHGKYYDFPQVYCFPKPAQKPHPPVILGSSSSKVFKRIVTWGNGWIPINVTPEQVNKGRVILDKLTETAGRDPASIEITVVDVPADRVVIEQFAKAGADRVIVQVESKGEAEDLDQLQRMAQLVLC